MQTMLIVKLSNTCTYVCFLFMFSFPVSTKPKFACFLLSLFHVSYYILLAVIYKKNIAEIINY